MADEKDYYSKAIDEAKEREAFYQQIVEELHTEERYKKYFGQFAPESPQLPAIEYYRNNFIEWFVATFETEETKKHFRDYGGDRVWNKTEEEKDEDQVQEWIDFLSAEAEVFPIRGWFDWREALERCTEDYSRQKIGDALPEAYAQYCMYRSNGLLFPEKKDDDTWDFICNTTKERILRGRKMCGEPEDLNF